MESILNNTQPIYTIPSFASVDEFALYTIASVEESYTDICKSIGIEELASFMEAEGKVDVKARVKAVIDKFVSFVDGLWKRIQGLIATARDKFVTFVGDKVKSLDSKKISADAIKKAVDASSDKYWSSFDEIVTYKDGFARNKLIPGVVDATADFLKEVEAAKGDKEKAEAINVNAIFAKDGYNELKLNADDYNNSAKVQAAVKDLLVIKGDINDAKKFAVDNCVNFFNSFKDGSAKKEFINEMKSPYNTSKKELDDLIKEAKKSNDDAAMKVLFKAATVVAKTNSAIIGGINAAITAAFSFKYRFVARCVFLAVNQLAKNEAAAVEESAVAPEPGDEAPVAAPAAEPATESAPVVESSSFQTELASLFDF